jgi:hypothetical protein
MGNSKLNLPPLLVHYIVDEGWRLTEIVPPDGIHYTPQAFEAEYGYLPDPLPPNACKSLRKKLPEYYAHRKQNPTPRSKARGGGRGFG